MTFYPNFHVQMPTNRCCLYPAFSRQRPNFPDKSRHSHKETMCLILLLLASQYVNTGAQMAVRVHSKSSSPKSWKKRDCNVSKSMEKSTSVCCGSQKGLKLPKEDHARNRGKPLVRRQPKGPVCSPMDTNNSQPASTMNM
jgi:hypothetical protein